jgi:NADPH:quinone reductase-like Zn-dependent oxidoreductase
LRAGTIRVSSPKIFQLSNARQAHAEIENRNVVGSIVLKVD